MSVTFSTPVGFFNEVDFSNATVFTLPAGTVTAAAIATAAGIQRSKLIKETIPISLPWDKWRVWNAFNTNLPGTSADDDLALVAGAFGTNSASIQSRTLKTLSTDLRARQMWELPPEYSAGQALTIRLNAGMVTTVAATSCTVDVSIYKADGALGVSADLVSTAAQSINSLTAANKDFVITPTGLTAGDRLDIQIRVDVVDGATGTEIYAYIYDARMLITLQG